MADQQGVTVTTTIQDLFASLNLQASTSYLIENISNQDVLLSKQASLPSSYPQYFNIIGSGGRISFNTSDEGEAFLVWVRPGSNRNATISVVES